jgi:N-hydroxyarylamine O-acetyltransferase
VWNHTAAAAYLQRIGVSEVDGPTSGQLRELQARHLLAVAFENLDIHLGVPIVLSELALHGKIVGRHRGGFCYELNGLFAALLTHLGYEVTLLAARVHTPQGLTPLLDHIGLRVQTPDGAGPWLVDVGFGRFSRHPLALDSRAEQSEARSPLGSFTHRQTSLPGAGPGRSTPAGSPTSPSTR